MFNGIKDFCQIFKFEIIAEYYSVKNEIYNICLYLHNYRTMPEVHLFFKIEIVFIASISVNLPSLYHQWTHYHHLKFPNFLCVYEHFHWWPLLLPDTLFDVAFVLLNFIYTLFIFVDLIIFYRKFLYLLYSCSSSWL